MIQGLLFWAYLDDDGLIHVKRYTDDRTIENFEKLPFVRGIFGPFEAFDMKHAQDLVKERYKQELN